MYPVGIHWEVPAPQPHYLVREELIRTIQKTEDFLLQYLDVTHYPHVVHTLKEVQERLPSLSNQELDDQVFYTVVDRIQSIMVTQLAQIASDDLKFLSALTTDELFIRPLEAPLIYPLLKWVKEGGVRGEEIVYLAQQALERGVRLDSLALIINLGQGPAVCEILCPLIQFGLNQTPKEEMFRFIDGIRGVDLRVQAYWMLTIQNEANASDIYLGHYIRDAYLVSNEKERKNFFQKALDFVLENKPFDEKWIAQIEDQCLRAWLQIRLAQRIYEMEKAEGKKEGASRILFREAISTAQEMVDPSLSFQAIEDIATILKSCDEEALAQRILRKARLRITREG